MVNDLSKLVAVQNSTNNNYLTNERNHIDSKLDSLLKELSQVNLDSEAATKSIDQLSSVKDQLNNKFDEIQSLISEWKNELASLIDTLGPEYYQKSEQIYKEMQNDSPTYTADRYLFNSLIGHEEIAEQFVERLELHASWKHPGLFIRPEKGNFVEPLLACDPLYITDESKELLLMIKQRWTKEYQARLRYSILDESQHPLLKSIPQNQIGLIVAYHFFNYKPLSLITDYLKEMFELLKPGGVLIFTFNNCNRPEAVKLVENHYQTYVPKQTLIPIAEGLGYEVINSFDLGTTISWLEVKKPGTLTSLRGGQALAQIRDSRVEYEVQDKPVDDRPRGLTRPKGHEFKNPNNDE